MTERAHHRHGHFHSAKLIITLLLVLIALALPPLAYASDGAHNTSGKQQPSISSPYF